MPFLVVFSDLSALLLHFLFQLCGTLLNWVLNHFRGFHEILRLTAYVIESWHTFLSVFCCPDGFLHGQFHMHIYIYSEDSIHYVNLRK